jgi:hypothetical protein
MKTISPLIRSRKFNNHFSGLDTLSLKNQLTRPIRQQEQKTPSSGFMSVIIDGAPLAKGDSSEQVEVWLPDGTRIVITGEKSIDLFTNLFKEIL